MKMEKILSNLCYYDKRNPDCDYPDDERAKKEKCFCDNCFYGRHELANELLKYKKALKDKSIQIEKLKGGTRCKS